MITNTKTQQIKPLRNFKVFWTYLFTFTHFKPFIALLFYLRTVILDFFLLQFSVKWGFRKAIILNVDHELDKCIPFRPDKAPVYLDFVNFWIRPLTMLFFKIGGGLSPHLSRYLYIIERAYAQASRFYKFRMTTTKRPLDYTDRNFFTIRLLDPHFLCVPSLHISIVVLAFSFFKDVFESEQFTPEEKQIYNAELYSGAISIAETVLYVKQHSVNCIPAALYMMLYLIPDLFTVQDAINFIDNLFVESGDIKPEDKKRINEHLHSLFEQLLLEGKFENDWLEPMKRWLLAYKAHDYGN